MGSTRLERGQFSTSTSKVYFLTGFSVIFADFYRIAAEWMIVRHKWKGGCLKSVENSQSYDCEEVSEKLLSRLAWGFAACRLKILIQRAGGGLQNQLTVRTIMQVILDVV